MRLVLLVLVSILLMTLDHRRHHLQSLRDGLSLIVAPVQMLVDLPVDMGNWISESLASRRALQEENASLKSQRLILEAQIQKLAALERENQRLRELLGSSFRVSERVLIAEIYSIDLDPYRHLVRINKALHDDVYIDQPLLDAHGVMGQIIEVTPTYSTARLITDPNHVIPVQVNRNGLRTLAIGVGKINELEMPYLPNNADVKVGDLLVTSGLGQIYPTGYPIAVITAVQRNPGSPFATVLASPTAHLDRSREVLLVWSQGRRGDLTNTPSEPAGQTEQGQEGGS